MPYLRVCVLCIKALIEYHKAAVTVEHNIALTDMPDLFGSRGQRSVKIIIEKSRNGWELQEIADRHLSCENFDLLPDDIERVEKLLSIPEELLWRDMEVL